MQILAWFETEKLFRLLMVCHRFRNLTIRIIQTRLDLATSLEDRKLILECYHPSAQYTEPYLLCDYLDTPNLSDDVEERDSECDTGKDDRFGRLIRLYSLFKPIPADINPKPVLPSPSVETSAMQNAFNNAVEASLSQPDRRKGVVKRTVNMDVHELFSQLCVSIALVQQGPRQGVFLSFMDVLKTTTTRIWRHWLSANASIERKGSEAEKKDNKYVRSTETDDPKYIIWIDKNRNVGLRVRVREKRWRRTTPILQHRDEDQPVSYDLELEGKFVNTYLCVLEVG